MTLYESIDQQIESFRSHSLEDLSNAVLMNRVDTKYLVPQQKILGLLHEVKNICTVLSIEGRRISAYKTRYFDSPDLAFYHKHHNGSLNRYKVRCRTYVEQGDSYLEVKFKNNKKRTIKWRTPVVEPELTSIANYCQFLESCGVEQAAQLVESQICRYYRVAFANEATGERLTLDFGLSFMDPRSKKKVAVENMAIIEVKQSAFNRSSDLSYALKRSGIRASNFSKYCVGLSLLQGRELKSNNFKSTLMNIEKINNQWQRGQVNV